MKSLAQGHTAIKVEELGLEFLLRAYCLRAWRGEGSLEWSSPQGTWAMPRNIFGGHSWWWWRDYVYCRHLVVRGQRCCSIPYNARNGLPTRSKNFV